MRRGRSRVDVEQLEPTSSRIILHLRRLSAAVLAGSWVDSAPCPSAHTAGRALERAATSISGPRAARALAGGAEGLEPTSSRIILRLRRLSVAVLAEGVGSTACPPHTAVSSSISPPAIRTERDASAGRGGAVRSCPETHPGGLGVLNARDMPCPKPAACPVPRRTTVPAPPHRLRWVGNATRRPGGAVRCGAVVVGRRVGWRPSAKGAHELSRLHMCLELRRHPWHSCTSLLGKTSDRRDAQRPWSVLLIATRPLGRPRPLGRHAAARSRSAEARGRAVGNFAGGGNKTRIINSSAAPGRNRCLSGLVTS